MSFGERVVRALGLVAAVAAILFCVPFGGGR